MIDQAIKLNTAIEVQGRQYEGLTVWVNALIASAGGQIVDENGKVKVDATAKQAAEIMKRLASSKAAPPGLSTNAEDQARLGFESGRSDFQINYPFIYPSAAEVKDPKDFQKKIGWARYPRVKAGEQSRPPLGGINLGVSAFSKKPDLAFRAARCLAKPENQIVATEKGGLPPTTESLYDDKKVKKAYPFGDLLAAVDRGRRAAPRQPGLQRHLAGDPEELPPAREHRAGRASSRSSRTGSRRPRKGRSSDGGGHHRRSPSPRSPTGQRRSASSPTCCARPRCW